MGKVFPEGGFDPTKVSFTPKWFVALVCAVIVILAGVGVGSWGYDKVKGLFAGALGKASPTEDF